jgi:threonine 3-dehydrogenase
MFAVKKDRAAPGLTWVDDAPVPALGPNDVLVAPKLAGICGTDKHIFEWDAWAQNRVPLGITVGHELMGVVVAVGDRVTAVQPGARVSAEGHIGCGHCQQCRTGNAHICANVQIIGVDRDGCFAKYIALPETNVWPLRASITDVAAAMMDPLGNAMHTVSAANVAGKSVLVSGVGVIGLMAVAIARSMGAARIFASDLDERHLRKALEFGADRAFRADDSEWTQQLRADEPDGVHVLLEMSGAERAMHEGFALLRNGGTAALLGLPNRPVQIDLANELIFKGTTVLGINGRRMYETWYQTSEFLGHAQDLVTTLVTHTFDVGDHAQAFDAFSSGEAIKILLQFPEV